MNNALTPESHTPRDPERPSLTPALPAQRLAPMWAESTPVFLVGMMGAGKTTIGKALAKVLRREFLDLDHELEARCGVRIPTIFEIEGEVGFRKRECQVLDDCSLRPGLVMATGGGAVLAAENRQALRTRGVVVYLRASVDELYRRTSRDRNRPLLATSDPRGTLRSLLALREPLYQEVADIVVDTGAVSVSQLVAQLVERLKQIDKVIDQQAQRQPENSSENMRAAFTASHPPENKPCTP
ncbi:MAG: shikimate kinase [Alcaligenaceae bacterium]|nr:MAG: shikimate kinase [Alcaligenaceae bacterium]